MICVKAGIGGDGGTTMDDRNSKLNRRDLFRMIGLVAGGSVMYQAMTSLGYAADSQYAGSIKLQGAPRGAKVIVLGAGMAGLVSALELRNAGYNVVVSYMRTHFGNVDKDKVSAGQVKGLRSMAH
jgi:glutamate dehydrogenase/leucine dehydrogenase